MWRLEGPGPTPNWWFAVRRGGRGKILMVVSFSSSESSSRGRTAASTCVYITQHHCRCPNHTIPCAANSSVTRCGDYRIPFAVLHVLCFYCTSATVCTVGIVTWKAWLMALMLAGTAGRHITLLSYICLW